MRSAGARCPATYMTAWRCLLLCSAAVASYMPLETSWSDTSFRENERQLKAVEMNGQCAVVAKRDDWGKPGEEKYDMHIKVFPWVVFGIVQIKLKPKTVTVDTTWAATTISNVVQGDTRVLTVELEPKSQGDYTFDMSGTGKITSLAMSCRKMVAPVPSTKDCKLKPEFVVMNSYNDLMSVQILLEGWQIGAMFDVSFKTKATISEAWNSERVIDEDHKEEELKPFQPGRFRLIQQNKKSDKDRKDSFGFDVTPALHDFPIISCQLIADLPPPPPPSLPAPSPPPPFTTSIPFDDCYLGGSAVFGVPPDPDALGVPWELDVTLAEWKPGVMLTLDFLGTAWKLKGHPLEIESLEPPDSVTPEAITHHSVTYKLSSTFSGGEVKMVAYGLIEGIGRITCCCAPPPPPPPGPPPSPRPSPPPSPRPMPPPPHPFEHIEVGVIQGGIGSENLFDDDSKKNTKNLSVRTATIASGVLLATVGFLFFSCHALAVKWREVSARRRITAKAQALVEKRVKEAATVSQYKGSNAELAGASEDDDDASSGLPSTEILIQLQDGSTVKMSLDIRKAKSINDLQRLIVQKWIEAGGTRRDSLTLRYEDAMGNMKNVTRNTPYHVIQTAPSLQLRTKDSNSGKMAGSKHRSYGRVSQQDELP